MSKYADKAIHRLGLAIAELERTSKSGPTRATKEMLQTARRTKRKMKARTISIARGMSITGLLRLHCKLARMQKVAKKLKAQGVKVSPFWNKK